MAPNLYISSAKESTLDAAALEVEKSKIKQQYELEMQALKKQFKEEEMSKNKLKEEMAKLKEQYDQHMSNMVRRSSTHETGTGVSLDTDLDPETAMKKDFASSILTSNSVEEY
uniref:Uncharacterized protein n=1 Tax=Romanomermis culicivorax TaxID=13658 RepID=A0A915JPN7_ROMCU